MVDFNDPIKERFFLYMLEQGYKIQWVDTKSHPTDFVILLSDVNIDQEPLVFPSGFAHYEKKDASSEKFEKMILDRSMFDITLGYCCLNLYQFYLFLELKDGLYMVSLGKHMRDIEIKPQKVFIPFNIFKKIGEIK